MIYQVGDTARIPVTFVDLTSTVADPTTISLLVQSPDGTQATYTYAASQVIKDSVGNYHYDLAITESLQGGLYVYRWTGAGTISTGKPLLQAVQEGELQVQATILTPQPPPSPPEFVYSDLLALDAAIKSGAVTVRFADREVRYRSTKDMLAARTMIVQYLNAQSGAMPIRQYRTYTTSGWGCGS